MDYESIARKLERLAGGIGGSFFADGKAEGLRIAAQAVRDMAASGTESKSIADVEVSAAGYAHTATGKDGVSATVLPVSRRVSLTEPNGEQVTADLEAVLLALKSAGLMEYQSKGPDDTADEIAAYMERLAIEEQCPGASASELAFSDRLKAAASVLRGDTEHQPEDQDCGWCSGAGTDGTAICGYCDGTGIGGGSRARATDLHSVDDRIAEIEAESDARHEAAMRELEDIRRNRLALRDTEYQSDALTHGEMMALNHYMRQVPAVEWEGEWGRYFDTANRKIAEYHRATATEHQSKDPNPSYGPDRVWVRVGEDSTGRACVANWMPSHAGTAHGPPPSEGTWQQYVRADAQPTECKSEGPAGWLMFDRRGEPAGEWFDAAGGFTESSVCRALRELDVSEPLDAPHSLRPVYFIRGTRPKSAAQEIREHAGWVEILGGGEYRYKRDHGCPGPGWRRVVWADTARCTECRSVTPAQARMALAWREACLCGRYDDEPEDERAFAEMLLAIEQESEDDGVES